MTAVPPNDIQQDMKQSKFICHYFKKPRNVIRDCRKKMKKEQEQRNDFSFQNTKPWAAKRYALCPHCQRRNNPPGKCWSGPNTPNRPKRFEKDQPVEKAKEGQEQGYPTHS